MSNHATMAAALHTAFAVNEADQVAAADALAAVFVAFADLVRGPAPVPYFSGEELKFAAAELAPAPDTAELIAEVRNLICEIRAERQHAAEDRATNNHLFRSFMSGAAVSGLPG